MIYINGEKATIEAARDYIAEDTRGWDIEEALNILTNVLNGCEESWDTMAADFGIEVLA